MKNQVETKKVKKTQTVFGKEITPVWRNEQKIINLAIFEFKGKANVNPTAIVRKAIELRTNPKFDLRPIDGLAKKVQTNFTNRVLKTLGGTIISANIRPSAQSKFFNFEIQTGLRLRFKDPIDPNRNISPQVKENTIINLDKLDLSKTKKVLKKFETLTKAQQKELDKLLNRGVENTTNPNDN